MTKETKIRILRVYSILLGISIIAAGICLIAGCISIYRMGDSPYSREVVASTFSKIAVPVYVCLCLTIISLVLELCFPAEKEKPVQLKDLPATLVRLHTTKNTADSNSCVALEIARLQRNRKKMVLTRTFVLAAASLVFLFYALNSDNFHNSDINGSMIKAMFILIPCLIISFFCTLYTAKQNEKSMQSEIELLKQLPNTASAVSNQKGADTTQKSTRILRIFFVTVGICFVTYGAFSGGIADVLAKAINICTECIGLG